MIRIIAFLALTAAAHAEPPPPCGPHDTQAAALAKNWGEVVQSQALNFDGRLAETFTNPKTASWTTMLTAPDGTACIVAGGKGFRTIPPGEPA